MTKNLFIILQTIFILVSTNAAELKSDTLKQGAIYHNYIDDKTPFNIHILEIDLTNRNIEVASHKAKSYLLGKATTSKMAKSLEKKNEKVIGAVNADFFKANGRPVGAQVVNGQLLKNPFPRSVFGMTAVKEPFIEIVRFQGFLLTDNNTFKIDAINSLNEKDELILYNKYYGDSANINNSDYMILAKYIKGPVVNDTASLIVLKKGKFNGSRHHIPENCIMLSYQGKNSNALQNQIALRDTIQLFLGLPPVRQRIKTLIGGMPAIVHNGQIRIDSAREKVPNSFSQTRHPRTAIGYNRSKTKLFLFVVDGRQEGYSIGMSLSDLADFMIDWDVYRGLNLDGGGSTTMYVCGEVKNRPSDATGEREVTNALIILYNENR